MKSNIKRVLSLLLCLCLTIGAVMALSSCNKEEEPTETQQTETPPQEITVIRPLTVIEEGRRLTRAMFQEVTVLDNSVPEGAVTDIKDITGKYLTTKLYPGDCVLQQHLGAAPVSSGSSNADSEDYVIVTEFFKPGTDISEPLQKLIDENPNRTLYFPDGTYFLSKPVKTPSDPAKTVSFRLTHRATLEANSTWEGEIGEAMIQLGAGAKAPAGKENDAGNYYYFMGGIVAGGSIASGISVEGTGTVLINNVSMKKTMIGIDIKTSYVDVDNVVIAGTNTVETIGVLVEGSYNTVSNMRICDIHVGIKLTAPNNVLRNLHPLYTPRMQSNDSCGFLDESSGNYFDYCYSDQFATGFRLAGGNASVLNGCFAFWYSDNTTQHWGIHVTGAFNSIIRATRVDMNDQKAEDNPINPDNAYLVVDDKTKSGVGKVYDPVSGSTNPYNGTFILNVVEGNDCLRDYWVK